LSKWSGQNQYRVAEQSDIRQNREAFTMVASIVTKWKVVGGWFEKGGSGGSTLNFTDRGVLSLKEWEVGVFGLAFHVDG